MRRRGSFSKHKLSNLQDRQNRIGKAFWCYASIIISKLPQKNFWQNLPPSLEIFNRLELHQYFQSSMGPVFSGLKHIPKTYQLQSHRVSVRAEDFMTGTPWDPHNTFRERQPGEFSRTWKAFTEAALLGNETLPNRDQMFEKAMIAKGLPPVTQDQVRSFLVSCFGKLFKVAQQRDLQTYLSMLMMVEPLHVSLQIYRLFEAFPSGHLSEELRTRYFLINLKKHEEIHEFVCRTSDSHEVWEEAARMWLNRGQRWSELVELLGEGVLFFMIDRIDAEKRFEQELDIRSIIQFGSEHQYRFVKDKIIPNCPWLKSICSQVGVMLKNFPRYPREVSKLLMLGDMTLSKTTSIHGYQGVVMSEYLTAFLTHLSTKTVKIFGKWCLTFETNIKPSKNSDVGSIAFCLLLDIITTGGREVDPFVNTCKDIFEGGPISEERLHELYRSVLNGGFKKKSDADSIASQNLPFQSPSPCCPICQETVDLKTCSRCRAVAYCGPTHQKKHWKLVHKKACKAPPVSKSFDESQNVEKDMVE